MFSIFLRFQILVRIAFYWLLNKKNRRIIPLLYSIVKKFMKNFFIFNVNTCFFIMLHTNQVQKLP